MNKNIRFIAMLFLFGIVIMNYLNYEALSIFKYGLVLFSGLYLFLLFRDWWRYR